MLLSVVPLSVIGASAEETPTVYTQDYYSYTVENDEATLIKINRKLTGGLVEIPAQFGGYRLTKIADKAFYGQNKITIVKIPNTVEIIGAYAFCNCYEIDEIVFGDNVKEVGEYAFSGCYNVSFFSSFGNSLEVIGKEAFYSISFNRISLPATIKKIGENAFRHSVTSVYIPNIETWYNIEFETDAANPLSINTSCNLYANNVLVENIDIPDGVTKINDYAFHRYGKLKTVKVSSTVESIADTAFEYCSNLSKFEVDENNSNYLAVEGILYNKDCTKLLICPRQKIDPKILLPDTVKEISPLAFYKIGTLKEIDLKNVEIVGDNSFYGCDNLSIVNSLNKFTSIGENAFYGCTLLEKIDFAEGLESIGNQAFYKCELLKTLNIPSTLKTIGDYAFYDTAIKSVSIPKTLNDIGTGAFSRCELLENVELSDNMTNIPEKAFMGCTALKIIDLPESVTLINANAFYESGLKSISFSQSSTVIKAYAFYGSAFESIELPQSITEIGEYAFSNCVSLKEIRFPDNLETISKNMLTGCSSLTNVFFGKNTKVIGDGVFYNCDALETLVLPEGIESIGEESLAWCENLQNITIPSTLKTVGFKAFYGSGKWKNIYLTDINHWLNIEYDYSSLEGGWDDYDDYYTYTSYYFMTCPFYYGGNLYLNNNLITDLVIPEGTTKINDAAFYGYSKLNSITVPDSLEKIGNHAFYNCKNLKEINFGNKIQEIGLCSFASCTSLEKVTIPGSITQVTDSSFNNCTSLTDVVLNQGTEGIGEQAFYNCKALTNVYLPKSLFYVCASAFENCDALKNVHYAGTKEERNDITFILTEEFEWGEYDGNKTLKEAKWNYKSNYYVELRFVDGEWHYFEGGIRNDSFNGLVAYKGVGFYIKNGKWSKETTLVKHNGGYSYVKNGKWKNTNTLVKYKGKWFYVKKGKWVKDTLIFKYNGKRFYVKKGKVDFSFSGKKKINGKTYKIKNGKVV